VGSIVGVGRAQGFGPTYRGGGRSSRIPTRRRADDKKAASSPANLPIQTRACRRRVAGQASLHLVTSEIHGGEATGS